jgi:hypothetical protein
VVRTKGKAIVKRTVMFAVAVALATGAGAASSAGTQVNIGLTGKALRGPVTPVCRYDRPCYAPFKGTLVFTPVTVGTVPIAPVRAQTAPNGAYRVTLAPARYRVTTGARTRFGNLVKPTIVRVSKAAGMRRVNFIIDTGIR